MPLLRAVAEVSDLSLTFPPELVDAIAERVLERLEHSGADPWLTVAQAADYISAEPQRIYDLRREGRLPRSGDGRRALIRRSALDRYLEQGST